MEKFISCPECGDSSVTTVNIRLGTSFGPWFCDSCGCGYKGLLDSNGKLHVKPNNQKRVKTLVLLRLDVMPPIHIVVKGSKVVPKDSKVVPKERPWDFSSDVYYYNEHTCPWNYLRLPVKRGEDVDPHGLFVHQETVLMPEGYDNSLDSYSEWLALFPSLKETNHDSQT